jgi:hypothetical protein
MAQWVNTGTVAVTNGSASVTGTGTGFDEKAVLPGYMFIGPDGKPYEVLQVVSQTQLTLAKNYTGPTLSGQSYEIAQLSYAAQKNTGAHS